MDGGVISNTSASRTLRLTPRLRFVERDIPDPADDMLSVRVRILQQAIACVEDGTYEWFDVPIESEKEEKPTTCPVDGRGEEERKE